MAAKFCYLLGVLWMVLQNQLILASKSCNDPFTTLEHAGHFVGRFPNCILDTNRNIHRGGQLYQKE